MDSAAGASRDSAEDKRYEYFAFISYKHEDMRWAKWLQQQIETYRLPAIIRKQAPHLPKQIRPVFRDQTDISTGPLLQNLRQELQDSRYLIVLCSPAAAKSEWVNREVQHFIDMGRAERIIPFVVAGTPNAANPEEECFPAILRGAEQSMLGVSVPELGKEKAFIKVVAKLLGLKFDQLWDRHRRRQRRQRLVRGLTAAVLFLAAAIGGFASWDYYRTKIAYYADYVQCRGVPQGIGPLERRTGPAPPSLVEIRVVPLPRRPRFEHQRQRDAGPRTRKTPIAQPIDHSITATMARWNTRSKSRQPERRCGNRSMPRTCRSSNSRGAARGGCRCRPSFSRPTRAVCKAGSGCSIGRAFGNRRLGVEV